MAQVWKRKEADFIARIVPVANVLRCTLAARGSWCLLGSESAPQPKSD
jgi:hypothetical protein